MFGAAGGSSSCLWPNKLLLGLSEHPISLCEKFGSASVVQASRRYNYPGGPGTCPPRPSPLSDGARVSIAGRQRAMAPFVKLRLRQYVMDFRLRGKTDW